MSKIHWLVIIKLQKYSKSAINLNAAKQFM
ncbi:hypothetical protein L21SP5_02371 [Salinivirga cyanobacteriivorans]|uniref:Uncharacterized protein n=1 Tax=Salinivirga cyanobacteriivorans TaxID=1307839 RepID=A0A0S2I176_9BACT|nr:hypothetical protein L21SP5_02371 [Salinivirga cyanobacteriivorans]